MALPTTITPGVTPGHVGDHEEIHLLLDGIYPDWLVNHSMQDTFANRPAAGREGRLFYATDTGELFYDTSSSWVYVGRALASAGEVADIADAEADGTSNRVSRADHVHKIGSVTQIPTLEVDLVNDKVAKLRVPACRVGRTTPRTIATGTAFSTGIGWDDETGSNVYDNDDIHSTVSNTDRLTATREGVWFVTAQIHWESNASGQRGIRIQKYPDDVTVRREDRAASPGEDWQGCAVDVEMELNDWCEIQVFQNSGGDLDVLASESFATMRFVTEMD